MTQTILADMAATKVLSAAFPVPAGLKTVAYFGSSGSGNGVNMVRDGPSLATLGPSGILSGYYTTLGQVGTQATMHATFSAGAIADLVPDVGGTLYTVAPAVTINGNGAGASGTVNVSGGSVTGKNTLTGGSAYTSATIVLQGGNYAGINTGVLRTTAFRDAGWTVWFAVRTSAASGAAATVVSDFLGSLSSIYTITLQNVDSGNSNQPTLVLYEVGQRKITLTLPGATTGWRIYAWTYSGGAAGTHNIYNLTDDQTATPYTASGVQGHASNYALHWGPSPTPVSNLMPVQPAGLLDFAHGGVANTCLSKSACQAIAASVRGRLSRRSIIV